MNARGDWHIDKKVSVTHLLATLSLAASVTWWGMQLQERVARVEEREDALEQMVIQRTATLEGRLQRSEDRIAVMFATIDQKLTRIEDRLDRKADR